MSKASFALVLWLKWGAGAVGRVPSVGRCSALRCTNLSHLLDAARGLWLDARH